MGPCVTKRSLKGGRRDLFSVICDGFPNTHFQSNPCCHASKSESPLTETKYAPEGAMCLVTTKKVIITTSRCRLCDGVAVVRVYRQFQYSLPTAQTPMYRQEPGLIKVIVGATEYGFSC